MAAAKNSLNGGTMAELTASELAAVNGGIGVTRPMEEGIYIDGVYVQTSAFSVYAMLNSGAVSEVVVRGI